MDAISTEGADWAALTPLIQERQAAIAARSREVADVKATSSTSGQLNAEEQRVVDQLKARDREVRDHEQAHKRVGGPYASQPTYEYQTGPDGQQYAVGGQVKIDVSPVADDPEATIDKMDVVKAAALAPAEPSSADRQVAAQADAIRTQALGDLAALRRQEQANLVDLRA